MPIILPPPSSGGVGLLLLRDYVRDELGPDLGSPDFISDQDIDRYLNDGLQRIQYYRERVADVTWAVNDESIPFPEDYICDATFVVDSGKSVPTGRIWANALHFDYSGGATSAGSARLFYCASWPVLSDEQGSLLPGSGNVALVAFACYRAFKRIASSRAEYRRYSTISQANAVSIDDLAQISDVYFGEFQEAVNSLPVSSSSTFFGE
jgi:hypothetical protein